MSSSLAPTATVPSPSSTDPPLFGTRTTSPSASATGGSNPYGGLDGGNPPSIYLICFVVIICLLLGVSFFVAARALLLRRRLHRAWAATGYSDTFFENNPTIAALHGVQGWGAGGWGANQVRKREKRLGKRPTMWEIELPEEDEEELEERALLKLKGASDDWEAVQPISVRIVSSPDAPPAVPVVVPTPPRPPPPTFLQTLRGPPMRPPQLAPAFFAAPDVPSGPVQTVEALAAAEPSHVQLELSVLVRPPLAPEQAAERARRRTERRSTLGAGGAEELAGDDDDDGEDLPELWIATERVDVL